MATTPKQVRALAEAGRLKPRAEEAGATIGVARSDKGSQTLPRRICMNTEIRTLNRFEDAGLNSEQSKAMVVGIDDLLVKSMAAFRSEIKALKYAQTGTLLAILIGFAGLIVAILTRA